MAASDQIALTPSNLGALPSGIAVPKFDVSRVGSGIVHIGLGGFHRAHMARYTHDLMEIDDAALEWGIVGAGLRATDRGLIQAMAAQNGLYTLVERGPASEDATVIGSIVGAIDASETSQALLEAIDDPATRIVSLTIT